MSKYKAKLDEHNYNFDLKTLNGNDSKWKKIKIECDKMNKEVQIFKEKFEKKLLDNDVIVFHPNKEKLNLKIFL